MRKKWIFVGGKKCRLYSYWLGLLQTCRLYHLCLLTTYWKIRETRDLVSVGLSGSSHMFLLPSADCASSLIQSQQMGHVISLEYSDKWGVRLELPRGCQIEAWTAWLKIFVSVHKVTVQTTAKLTSTQAWVVVGDILPSMQTSYICLFLQASSWDQLHYFWLQ